MTGCKGYDLRGSDARTEIERTKEADTPGEIPGRSGLQADRRTETSLSYGAHGSVAKKWRNEKETIINWNEAENLASIYTFNASLKRRLAEFSRKYPLLCRLECGTPEGSVTYVLDKSRLSIRLVPPYSEERKAAASAYAREHGFQVVTAEEKIA